MADVKITTTHPSLGTLGRRLGQQERAILRQHARKIREAFQDPWVGWKYEGRPAKAPRLVSYDAWTERVDSTARGPAIVILNEARGWRSGKPYVAYVKRSKKARAEVDVLADQVNRAHVPAFVADLTAAIVNALNTPGPSREIRPGSSETETLELEI